MLLKETLKNISRSPTNILKSSLELDPGKTFLKIESYNNVLEKRQIRLVPSRKKKKKNNNVLKVHTFNWISEKMLLKFHDLKRGLWSNNLTNLRFIPKNPRIQLCFGKIPALNWTHENVSLKFMPPIGPLNKYS